MDCDTLRCIALTFDDGPGPYTQRLLTELDAAHVHATFFLIGQNAIARPSTVRDELAHGEVLGNHTWSHPDLTRMSPTEIGQQLDRTAKAIESATGQRPHLARPPYGAMNPTVQSVLRKRDLPAILWNVDTEDWKNRSVEVTTQRALDGARPGAIILMHDIHPTTVQAVPDIIEHLKARGFTLVTIPQLLGSDVVAGGRYSSH